MVAKHLTTTGMTCEACETLIQINVERLPGVIAAHADRHTGLTTVLYDPKAVDALEVADEIHRSGFRARLISYPGFVSSGDAAQGTGRNETKSVATQAA